MDNTNVPPVVRNKDEGHLRLLATFHYVVAGLGALFACMPLMHVAMGVMMLSDPSFFAGGQKTAQPPPPFIGYFFIAIGGAFVLLGWAAAVCTFISGRFLAKRRKRMFSFVVAALLCMFFPFGTVLGVFTIIELSKESVQRLYEAAPGTSPPRHFGVS
jgi:hypothetical protein